MLTEMPVHFAKACYREILKKTGTVTVRLAGLWVPLDGGSIDLTWPGQAGRTAVMCVGGAGNVIFVTGPC